MRLPDFHNYEFDHHNSTSMELAVSSFFVSGVPEELFRNQLDVGMPNACNPR